MGSSIIVQASQSINSVEVIHNREVGHVQAILTVITALMMN